MPRAYSEDQLVEQPAIGLFAELGWQVALPHPHPDPHPVGEGAAGPPPTAGVAGEVPVGWWACLASLRRRL